MAVHFHDLPHELFPDALQPKIKRFNYELRDLFGLEGTLTRSRSNTKRSDDTIASKQTRTVNVTRVEGLTDEGSPVSQLTQDQIDILNGDGDLTWELGFGPVLPVYDGSTTRYYRVTLVWNASVTPARPMVSLVEV